jgi:hypothetical protein
MSDFGSDKAHTSPVQVWATAKTCHSFPEDRTFYSFILEDNLLKLFKSNKPFL